MYRGVTRGICCALVALACVACASSASASEIIGRLAPTPSASCAGSTSDQLEPTVTSGASYVVAPLPGAFGLEISSWSHNAAPAPPPTATAALTFKVFRPTSNPTRYTVVAHDGPRNLQPAALNTFQTHIPVVVGDVIGLNSAIPAYTACTFADPGQTPLIRIPSDLADGETGDFAPAGSDRSVNISAVVSPSGAVTLGDTRRNKKKGTATLVVNVLNPGTLAASGTGVRPATLTPGTPGVQELVIRAMGKAKKKLNKKGKVSLTVDLTFTPNGGFANSRQVDLQLKKKRKKKR